MELVLGVLADIHGRSVRPVLETFKEYGADGVIVAGDIRGRDGTFFPLIKELESSRIPAYAVPGSHDWLSEWGAMRLESAVVSLPSARTPPELGEYSLMGIGGSTFIPSIVPMAEAFTRDPVKDAALAFRKIEQHVRGEYILVTHDPPFEYGDMAWFVRTQDGSRIPATAILADQGLSPAEILPYTQFQHVGDVFLKKLVEGQRHPRLAVCGHIHENYRFASPGRNPATGTDVGAEATSHLVLNPGPWMEGMAALVYLGKDTVRYEMVVDKRA